MGSSTRSCCVAVASCCSCRYHTTPALACVDHLLAHLSVLCRDIFKRAEQYVREYRQQVCSRNHGVLSRQHALCSFRPVPCICSLAGTVVTRAAYECNCAGHGPAHPLCGTVLVQRSAPRVVAGHMPGNQLGSGGSARAYHIGQRLVQQLCTAPAMQHPPAAAVAVQA